MAVIKFTKAKKIPRHFVFQFPACRYSDVARDLILRRDQVELGRRLGSGNFGVVYLANVHVSTGGTTAAAVKEPKAGEVGEFEKEVEIVCKVHQLGGHPNIVSALGYVPEGQNRGKPLLVLEYCPLGDLKAYVVLPSPCRAMGGKSTLRT